MTDTAHLFTPQNDSLKERIRAAQVVFDAFERVQEHLQQKGDLHAQQWLGEADDIEYANQAIHRSVSKANQAITSQEWQLATEQGLLTPAQFQRVQQLQALQAIQQVHEDNHSHKHSFSNKQ